MKNNFKIILIATLLFTSTFTVGQELNLTQLKAIANSETTAGVSYLTKGGWSYKEIENSCCVEGNYKKVLDSPNAILSIHYNKNRIKENKNDTHFVEYSFFSKETYLEFVKELQVLGFKYWGSSLVENHSFIFYKKDKDVGGYHLITFRVYSDNV